MEHLMWQHLQGPITYKEKRAELLINDNDRYMIALYALRIALLDRLIALTTIDIKQHPSRQLIETDSKIGFRCQINKCRQEKGKDAVVDASDEIPLALRRTKRGRSKPLLKDSYLLVDMLNKKRKTVLLTSLCSLTHVPQTGNNILCSNIKLNCIQLGINKKPTGLQLAQTYNDSKLVINNDDRLQYMIKTQRDATHDDRDNDIDLVYNLTVCTGLALEDGLEWYG